LTTETLAEQNVTISLYISEITIDGNILRFDANLTKGFDEETDSHFFYLDKFIDGSDVDLKNPTKFEIAFEYADEKFYGEFISNGIVDSDGTLLKDTILFTVKRLNIENPPAVTVIEDFQLQNGFNKTIVDITFDNVFRTRSFENLDAVPDFRVEATNENAEILLLHFSMYSEDENAIVGKISDETDISYKSILGIRLDLDRNISQWIEGKSSFALKIENQTYNFDISVNGKNLVFEFQFAPYIETFYDETFESNESRHEITVIGNDPDGDNSDLTYSFYSPNFLIDQNGSNMATLEGRRGVLTVVVTDSDGNSADEVELVIGSFQGLKSCINAQLGISEDENASEEMLSSITKLSCASSGIETLDGIEKLSNLTELDLSGNGISDISLLANLGKLETLYLKNNEIENIDSLSGLDNLKILDVSDNEIYKITAVPRSVESLDLEDNSLEELDLLFDLFAEFESSRATASIRALHSDAVKTNGVSLLQFLKIGGNYIPVQYVQHLQSLPALKKVLVVDLGSMKEHPPVEEPFEALIRNTLGKSHGETITQEDYNRITSLTVNSKISDISGIERLKNLKSLYFSYSKVSDFSEVAELENLESLSFYYNNGLKAIPEVKSLKTLYVNSRNYYLEDISALGKMPYLTSISFYSGRFTKLPVLKNPTSFYSNVSTLSDISGFENVSTLKSVSIENAQITEISSLGKSTGITNLNLRNTKVSEVSILKNLTAITSLTLYNVDEVSDIKHLANLQTLDLRYSKTENLDFMKGKEKLQTLYLYGHSNLVDVSGLENLNITYFELFNNSKLENIASIGTLKNLQNLYISGNGSLKKIPDVSDLEKLTYLELVSNGSLVDISELAYLYNLPSLKIHNNDSLSDISALASLEKLNSLTLSDNPISDISPISDLNITSLTISNNPISDISPIGNLKKLDYLSLHDNNISDISPIGNVKTLTTLNLSSSTVSDISVLSNLENLSTLYLRYLNSVTDFSPLEDLEKLQYLTLYNTDSIETLPTLATSMYKLEIYYNDELSDISSISELTNLKYADVQKNYKIVEAPKMEELSNLYTANFYYNSITNASGFEEISHKLGTLDLRNNVISEDNISVITENFRDRNIVPTSYSVSNQRGTRTVLSKFLNLDANFTKSGDIVTDHVSGLKWEDGEIFEGNFSEAYQYCQDLELGGITNWRLPTNKELWYLADRNQTTFFLNPTFQNGNIYNWFWTNQKYVYSNFEESSNFVTNFIDGSSSILNIQEDYNVSTRCVSGVSRYERVSFSRDTGTVSDTTHGLIWQDIENNETYTFEEATSYCANLPEYDWRLPTIEELYSITNQRTEVSPTVNGAFQNTEITTLKDGEEVPEEYWSSSTLGTDFTNSNYDLTFAENSRAVVSFAFGLDSWEETNSTNFVRCVRDQ
jgi:Leucine-rich repeat (LRR) protein